jgi:hypothetical protein
MLGIIAFVANVVTHGVQVKDKLDNVFPNHHPRLMDLCESSNKDGTIPIFVHPFNFLLFEFNYM